MTVLLPPFPMLTTEKPTSLRLFNDSQGEDKDEVSGRSAQIRQSVHSAVQQSSAVREKPTCTMYA